MNKQIIIRVIAGKASNEEKEAILRWVDESDENRQYYNQLKNIWVIANLPNTEVAEVDLEKLRKLGYYKKKNSKRLAILVVAILLVPLLAINIYFLIRNQELTSGIKNQKNAHAVFSTNKGVKGKVVLPDGSIVWLNCDSYIKFPDKFDGGTRKVEFSGEGYFIVAKNSEIPMVITTNRGVEVEVKGTTFNLTSYGNDSALKATLYNGSITLTMVSPKTGKKKIVDLKPMEVATVYSSNIVKVQTMADTVVSSAWKNGDVIFDNELMSDVIKTLERRHGVVFFVKNDKVLEYRFTAHFNSESIVQIMEMLKFCSPITYSIKGNIVTLDSLN